MYDGGAMRSEAKDYENFLRVDDLGNEVVVRYKEQIDSNENIATDHDNGKGPTIEELIQAVDHSIEAIENLPDHAKYEPCNQYDICSILLTIKAVLRKIKS